MAEVINSSSNPLIKQARSLRQKKARDESGLFLVEGILHVGEAAEAGWDLVSVLYCDTKLKSDFGRHLIQSLNKNGVRCQPVSELAFAAFSEKDNPQGIAALVRQKHQGIDEIASFELAIGIVSPQDPGNVGTILRTIDATGADALLLLDGGVDPYHPSAVRASMGTMFWKPFFRGSFLDFADLTEKKNIRVIGTSAHASIDYLQIRRDDRPTILLLGSEQKGLLPEQLAICSDLVSLPMRGRATSLNLAVAAGVFLYSLMG
jgi:TrmH family RNA methyltransferase